MQMVSHSYVEIVKEISLLLPICSHVIQKNPLLHVGELLFFI